MRYWSRLSPNTSRPVSSNKPAGPVGASGVGIHDASMARQIEQAIETDMQPGNSWHAAEDKPDQYGSFGIRGRIRLWQQLPIKPLL